MLLCVVVFVFVASAAAFVCVFFAAWFCGVCFCLPVVVLCVAFCCLRVMFCSVCVYAFCICCFGLRCLCCCVVMFLVYGLLCFV